jgi:beta-1,4-mannosyl-glycoprotein beta-1,4-N-acetylglucosaminyltransferase
MIRTSLSLLPARTLKALLLSLSLGALLLILWAGRDDDILRRINEFDLAVPPDRLASSISGSPTADDDVPPRDFCRRHGWDVYKPSAAREGQQRRRKVYDLFMVNTELDWLEIRLNSTYEYVDYFVAVEASKTFTGRDKSLAIRENWERFAPYRDKIIYHEVEFPADFHPETAWGMEDFVRDAMYTQVLPRLTGPQAPAMGDAIIVADVDEIARPHAIELLRACAFPRRLTLGSRFYYYSFQFLHRGEEWPHPQATFYQGASRTLLPSNLRNGDGGFRPLRFLERANLGNAAWHCSSCFDTIQEMLTKMASFSHTSLNHEYFRDRDRIADHVRGGLDLWDREGQEYDRIEGNVDVPSLVLNNRDRFGYLMNRDGQSAGFSDYP